MLTSDVVEADVPEEPYIGVTLIVVVLSPFSVLVRRWLLALYWFVM